MLIPMLLLVLAAFIAMGRACEQGWYDDSGLCRMCDQTCRECADAISCTVCENYMYLSADTIQKCMFCGDGEYYDFSYETCRSCDGKCTGYCKGQKKCFECDPSKVLDLETLVCVSTCNPSKIEINSSQYSISTICRLPQFYVDPLSSEMIELGTIQYPYKSMRAITSDILNNFSHKDVNITIYLKEYSSIFISDLTGYFLNITSVKFMSYSANSTVSTSPGKANLIPTQIDLPAVSMRTAFHILQNMDLNLQKALDESKFTVSELGMIYGIKATLCSVRTSIYIQNINIRREAVDSDLVIVFLQLVYLQSKILDVRDVNFEISGTAFQSFDPLNIYFDSLSIDTYTLRNFAVIFTTCNYPEASLTGTFYANNITVSLSSPKILNDDPGIFNYIGPANVSFTGLELSNWFAREPNLESGVFITTGSGCVPNDGNIQLFSFANATLSLPNNPYSFLYNGLYVVVDQNIYRIGNVTFDNCLFANLINSFHQIIFTIGNFGTDIYITNSIFKDSSFYEIIISVIGYRNVMIYNNEFSNFSSVHFNIIGSYYCLGLNVNQNKFINLNFDKSSDYEAIVLGNLNITNTYIGNIYFYNVSLHGHPFVKSYDLIFKIVIENCYFNGIYQEDFNDLFAIGSVGGIIFNNNTFISISNSILSINKIDLSLNINSQLSNLQISNSSATIIIFGNFINPTASVQTILVENITVFNSEISSNIDLITTERISSTASVNMIFNNFKFSGIKFANKGNLLLLKHNMPQEIIISNLTLTNLTSALITAESTGSDGTISVMHSKLVNCIFDQINNQFSSLININNKAIIEITNSSFSNIYSYEEGAILFAGQDKTSVTFSNCAFQNNSSVQGTIFVIESESLVQCINCTFLYNFGVENTIFQTNLNGYFYFYNSSISNNYAINNPVGQLFDSASNSILSNVSIYNNEAMSIEEVSSEFSIKCNKLCFVPKNLIQYITTNNKLALSTFKASLIQIIVSSLSIQNYSTLQNQNIMFNVFLSELKLINTSIYNISSSIQASSSNVTIIDSTIDEVINIDKTSFIFLDYNSILTINSSILLNSTSSLINARNSEIILDNLTITEVYSPSNLFQISNCDGVAINGLMINNCSASNQEFINIDKSSNVQLSKFSGTKKNITFINILNSEVISIDSFIINEFLQPLNIKSSRISLISNSSFANNGNRSLTKGGAISITDSQVSIRNTNFANNSAIIGGAISFECSGSSFCSLSIVNSIFKSNTGASQGGAIYYNYYRPIIDNVTFLNNYAIYGPNFASFASKIKFADSNTDEMKIHDLVSGVEYNQTLKFSLEDFDNQTMVLNNVNLISISPINKTDVSIRGISSVLVTKGVASFENFIAIAKPGSSSIQFQVSSQAINYDKVKAVYNVLINNIMFADFRYCQPGEVQLADMSCSKCAPGTFSLNWNSTECQQCLSNAVCEGGNQLNLDSGFWRKTINTSTIVQCLNPDACSGGFINQEYGPTNCGVGYTGILCDSCQIENGVKYEKISDNTCSKCPSPILNFIRVISLSLLVFAFISCIILINIRKTKESEMSVLFRILTNYLQIISSLLSFDIKYPTTISNLFVPLNQIGSSEVFLSFDCFVSDYNIKGPFPSNKALKVFLTAILPGVLLIIFCIIWITLRVIWRKLVPDLKRNIAISFISIIFLLHPRLVQNSIVMLQCVTIDSGDSRAKIDLEEQCYSTIHTKLIFAIAFPSLVVWVLGMPITALILLFKNFKKEENNKVKQYLLILYQGLRTETFYWEFINTFIKALILLIFIALSFLKQTVKIFLASIFIFGIIRIQMKVSPYKEKENNFLEVRAMTASLLTLMVGIVFAQDTQIGFINIFFLLFVVFQNLWFLSEWLHLFCVCMGDRYKVFVYLTFIMKVITLKKLPWFTKSKSKKHGVKSSKTKSRETTKTKRELKKKNRNWKRFDENEEEKKEQSDRSIHEELKIDISTILRKEESKANSYLIEDNLDNEVPFQRYQAMRSKINSEEEISRRSNNQNKNEFSNIFDDFMIPQEEKKLGSRRNLLDN